MNMVSNNNCIGAILLFVLWTLTLQGQSPCNCPLKDAPLFFKCLESADTSCIYQYVDKLNQSEEVACQIFAIHSKIEWLFKQRKLEEIGLAIQEQEKVINLSNCKQDFEVQLFLNYARYYSAKEDYENLSLFAFKALEKAEQTKDLLGELRAIQHIVHLFTRQDEDQKNWDYIQKAQAIIFKLPKDHLTANHYNWLAFQYENVYTFVNRSSLLDSALLLSAIARTAARNYEDFLQITQSYRVLEAVSYHRNHLEEALTFLDSALYFAKKIYPPVNLASFYVAKAWDHLDLGQFSEAIKWQDTCLSYAMKMDGYTAANAKLYQEAIEIYGKAGDLQRALDASKKYQILKDSVFSLQRTEKIIELEQQYQKAKNEKKISELAQQKRIYLLLAVAGLFGLSAFGFWARQAALTQKQKILEVEQRLNRARINPHFFFNVIASIQALVLKEKDRMVVATLLAKFSNIMRQTLENTYEELVPISQEIDFLNQYLLLQQIRFPNKFDFKISVDESLDEDLNKVPPMIVQPFVENSIEHGFKGMDYMGMLEIYFKQQNNALLIQILDNGKGLVHDHSESSAYVSRAHQIIKDRVFLVDRKTKSSSGLVINNRKDTTGVIVNIKLPLSL